MYVPNIFSHLCFIWYYSQKKKSDADTAKVAEASTAVSPSSSQELEKPGSSTATTDAEKPKVDTNAGSTDTATTNSDSEANTVDDAADDADESDLTTDEEKEIGQVVDAATTTEPASKDGKWVNIKEMKPVATTANWMPLQLTTALH